MKVPFFIFAPVFLIEVVFIPIVKNTIWNAAFVLFVFVLVFASTYFRTVRNSNKTLKKLNGNPVMLLKVNEEGMESTSELGRSELKWKTFEKLWCFSDLWLLFTNAMSYMVLPTERLSPELQGFIMKKLQENSIKVK